MRQCVRPPLVYAPQVFLRRQDRQSELNRRQICLISATALLRMSDFHARRNRAKATLTSSSLAASPVTPSSIAANSSGVASYPASASSAFISRGKLGQLVLPVVRPG